MRARSSAEPPLRLALCTVGELFGGVERQVLDLALWWRREGLGEPLLFLFQEGELARRARAAALRLQILPAGRLDPRPASSLAARLREDGIDVVHAHGYKAAVLCALARSRYPFALVKTEHGRQEPGGPLRLATWRETFYRGLESLATRRAVHTVCYVTDDLRRHCARAHRGAGARTVANGIDPLERSAWPRPEELEPDLFQASLIGRVTRVKGVDLALEAFAAGMPPDVRLNVVGTGPLLPGLRQEAQRRGLSRQVRFWGFRRDVYAFIAHSDLLLMPSRHEGLPYTLLEAMSLETPVAATRVGGLAEVLRDRETGLLVPPGDVAAIREACLLARSQPWLRVQLATAARQRFLERYTLDRMGADYLEIYRRAAAAGPRCAPADARGA